MGEVLAGKILVNARDHAVPAASFYQAQNRDQKRPEPDQEELQDLVKDGREQSACSDVNAHSQR